MNVIICNFTKSRGRFLFWTYELWEVGGGAGVEWWFCGIPINLGRWNPLWLIFYLQSKDKKTLDKN